MKLNKMAIIATALISTVHATGSHAASVSSLTVEEIGGVAGMTMAAATASNAVAATPFVGESGGVFYFGAEKGNGVKLDIGSGDKVWGTTNTADNFFAPPGNTTAGQITMGVIQGYGQMSDGFRYGGSSSTFSSTPNSVNGAITGSWTGLDGVGQLVLDLSGFSLYMNAFGLNVASSPNTGQSQGVMLNPDGSVVTNPDGSPVYKIDNSPLLITEVQTINGIVYYTADWSHVTTVAEDPIGLNFTGQRGDWHMEGVLTAVPEASTYGMMLAGLGLIGGMVISRRRKMA